MSIPKIESGIPAPTNIRRPPVAWKDFKVGDSVFIPAANIDKVSTMLWKASKRHGYKFTARTLVEDGIRGVRAWRIDA